MAIETGDWVKLIDGAGGKLTVGNVFRIKTIFFLPDGNKALSISNDKEQGLVYLNQVIELDYDGENSDYKR